MRAMNMALLGSLDLGVKVCRAPSPLHSSLSPHRRVLNLLSCVPGSIWSLCSPCPCLKFLISDGHWVSKTPVFRYSQEWTCIFSLGRRGGSTMLFPLLAGPRRTVARVHSVSQFMIKQSRKPAPRPASPSQLPCTYAWEQCSMLVPHIFLATPGDLHFHSCFATWAPVSQACPLW